MPKIYYTFAEKMEKIELSRLLDKTEMSILSTYIADLDILVGDLKILTLKWIAKAIFGRYKQSHEVLIELKNRFEQL